MYDCFYNSLVCLDICLKAEKSLSLSKHDFRKSLRLKVRLDSKLFCFQIFGLTRSDKSSFCVKLKKLILNFTSNLVFFK